MRPVPGARHKPGCILAPVAAGTDTASRWGKGFDVVRASGSDDAVAILDGGREFDILITDVRLERETGPEVVRRVKSHLPNIAVLYMSGYAADAVVDHQLADAAFLNKPFGDEELLRTVDGLLSQ